MAQNNQPDMVLTNLMDSTDILIKGITIDRFNENRFEVVRSGESREMHQLHSVTLELSNDIDESAVVCKIECPAEDKCLIVQLNPNITMYNSNREPVEYLPTIVMPGGHGTFFARDFLLGITIALAIPSTDES